MIKASNRTTGFVRRLPRVTPGYSRGYSPAIKQGQSSSILPSSWTSRSRPRTSTSPSVGGAIRNKENMERVKKLRQQAKTVIAFGTCACLRRRIGLIHHPQPRRDTERRVHGIAVARRRRPSPRTISPSYYTGATRWATSSRSTITSPAARPRKFSCERSFSRSSKGTCRSYRRNRSARNATVTWNWSRTGRSSAGTRACRKRGNASWARATCASGSVTFGRCGALCTHHGIPCHGCGGPSLDVLREPCRDLYNILVMRIQHLTDLPQAEIEKELYDIPHTIYPFVMGSKIMENKSVSKIPDIIKERHL